MSHQITKCLRCIEGWNIHSISEINTTNYTNYLCGTSFWLTMSACMCRFCSCVCVCVSCIALGAAFPSSNPIDLQIACAPARLRVTIAKLSRRFAFVLSFIDTRATLPNMLGTRHTHTQTHIQAGNPVCIIGENACVLSAWRSMRACVRVVRAWMLVFGTETGTDKRPRH